MDEKRSAKAMMEQRKLLSQRNAVRPVHGGGRRRAKPEFAASHSLIPNALFHSFSYVIGCADGLRFIRLPRSQHEMIATMVVGHQPIATIE